MVALILLAALLQQQGPKSLDIDPAKVQPAVVVPARHSYVKGGGQPIIWTLRVTGPPRTTDWAMGRSVNVGEING